jgi:hypothetical protein
MPGLTRHPVNNGFYWITHTIPGVRPAGQPAAVQIRSRRICPAFAGMTGSFKLEDLNKVSLILR